MYRLLMGHLFLAATCVTPETMTGYCTLAGSGNPKSSHCAAHGPGQQRAMHVLSVCFVATAHIHQPSTAFPA